MAALLLLHLRPMMNRAVRLPTGDSCCPLEEICLYNNSTISILVTWAYAVKTALGMKKYFNLVYFL